MKTEIIRLDKNNIDRDKLSFAADVIKGGGLVAFPTETVYGLGANAYNSSAAKRIFEVKGRPGDNPLIVHIADRSALNNIASGITPRAAILMDKFWPGPLTLIMDKSDDISEVITAKLSTVAVRMPAHPVALALINASGLPIAAPSANLSGKSSPTSPEHVINDLMGKVEVIIDAGSCNIGLESTILDITASPPMLLRPGGITPDELEAVIGQISFDPTLTGKKVSHNITPKAPGMKYTHYSPKADLIIIDGGLKEVVDRINNLKDTYESQGLRVGILATEQTKGYYGSTEVISLGDRANPKGIASRLFWSFREFDKKNTQIILAEAIDNKGIGLAIMNRMIKAAGYNIIHA